MYDEARYLALMANGDEQAFCAIYKHYADRIFKNVLKYVGCHHFAEDICQEVFAKIWEKRQRFANIEEFDSYLFRAARNSSLNFIKQAKRKRYGKDLYENIPEMEVHDVEEKILFKELHAVYIDALETLTSTQAVVYEMAAIGYQHKVIAEMLSISGKTVAAHMTASNGKIRKHVSARLYANVDGGLRA